MSIVTSICVVLPMEAKIWKLQSDCIIPSFWLTLFLSFQLQEDTEDNNMLSHSNNNDFPNKSSAFSFLYLYYCLGSPSLQIQMCGRPSAKAVFLFYLFIY